MSTQMRLRNAVVVGLFFLSSTATADDVYYNVRVLGISAVNATTDFEVVFDRKVCNSGMPASRARVDKLVSVNHELLFSAVMAAFLSNFRVNVTTTDDPKCLIQSFEISR